MRATNEDSVVVVVPEDVQRVREKGVLAVVADGMGGHAGGEVASSIATARVTEAYYAAPGPPQQSLLVAFDLANRQIYDLARRSRGLAGMGTTCTAVAVVNGLAYSAHVGDSRAYLIRDGQIYCMTEDHSVTGQMVKRGILTRAQAREHEERHVILRAMGTHTELEADCWNPPFPVRSGDRLLLCSDGLCERIEDRELAAIASGREPEPACRELIRIAVERVSSDNVSAAVLQLRGPMTASTGIAGLR